MLAYLVLLLAVLSRILPHAFHDVSWNFTALGGGLLFFGSRMGNSKRAAWMLPSAVAVLMATDYYLTVFAYGYPFQLRDYLVTWLWYAIVCLLGMGLLQKPTVPRVVAGALATSTSFFLLTNFAFWAGPWHLYPHSLAGLSACYIAGLPFYRNDLVSTALTAGVLFGLPLLAARIADTVHSARRNSLPLA
ncbi:MAG TPA: DUF6580 family putative transport protein [Acidobacteriaceae bacterium]|jgi:hypothetical protein|nr:DUF6580 family putative transport protein [Acidobacteriaceae bacterium]